MPVAAEYKAGEREMDDEQLATALEQQIQRIEDFIEVLLGQKAELEFQIEELSKVKQECSSDHLGGNRRAHAALWSI